MSGEMFIGVVGVVGIVGLAIIGFYLKKRSITRRMKINAEVERIRMANRPGYHVPNGMDTTIRDGVIKYKKKRRRSE